MNGSIGKVIAGRFRLESVIGSGGIGTVYRAIQEPLDRPVAIKMLRPEFSESPELRRRFVREARAVAALSHPNIAMVHDFGVGRDRSLFMAMEFVEGLSFSEVLDSPAVDFEQIATLFDQILTGLSHAHARGIIHRDIKPGNILVTAQEDGSPLVKIVDFGIAAVAGFNWEDDEHSTGSGQVVGTPQYMAPEQARGERHMTATVDVYAVGLMLYRAITGREAFDGDNAMDILMAQVSQPPPPIEVRDGLDVPSEVRRVIEDALAKSPRDRIPSANVFRSRLRRLVGHPTSPSLPRAVFQRPTRISYHGLTVVEEAPTVDVAATTGRSTAVEGTAAVPHSPWAPPLGPALRGETPLVGRETEIERLVQSIYDAVGSETGVVLLLDGEAGMGKSRVAGALREHLSEHAGFLTGHGLFHREGERGLRGLREAMDDVLGTRGLQGDAVRERLESRLSAVGMTAPADIATLTGFLRHSHEPGLAESDGSATAAVPAVPNLLFDTIYRVIVALGREAPVALVIEDVQWAGREAEAFLELVATELQHQRARAAVIVTAQVGEVETNEAEQLVRRLARFDGATVLRHKLNPLEPNDARRLIRSLIRADDELADALVKRAGGNPMHLVQLVRYVVEQGMLEAVGDSWRARPGVDVSNVLPPSLADIMALRLDQLEQIVPGSRLRDLLNRCAVLGRSFPFSALERMLQIENRSDLLETVDADIDALLDEEYLRMRPTRTDDILAFPSSLVRDTLVAGMRNRRTTRRLHAYAAEAKLSLLGNEPPDPIAEELMRHYGEARDRPRELQYASIAADVAEHSHRPYDAAAHLQRAVDVLEQLGTDEDTEQSTWIRLRLGRLLIRLGSYRDAADQYEHVENDPRASERAQVMANYGHAKVARVLGELDEARHRYHDALRAARSLGDAENIVRGSLGLARVEILAGNLDQAQGLAQDALGITERGDAPRQLPESLWILGEISRSRGEVDTASEQFRRAIELFHEADDRTGIAKCRGRLAVIERSLGHYDTAIEYYEQAREMYADLGDRKGVAHQLNGLGDVARFRGEFPRAADLYRRAVDIFQSLHLPYDAAIALTNLGLVAMESGRDEEAESAFRRAADVAQRVGAAYLSIGIGLNLACVLARMGLDDESQETLDRSLALADASDLVDPDYARPLERLADVLATAGDRTEARAILSRARTMWHELGRHADAGRIDQLLTDEQA